MAIDNNKIRKMYINRDKMLNKTFEVCHFKLKYDYTSDDTLNKIASLLENQTNRNKELIDLEVEKPFYEYFFEILDELDSDKIFNLMSAFYFKSEILKDRDRTIVDCYSRVDLDKDNNLKYSINLPDQERDSSMLYAAHTHELIHLPQFTRKRHFEYLEYSEVLSMYFEYLMYEKINPGKGKKIFINNRVKQLGYNKDDFESDLYCAKNNKELELDRSKFSLLLADHLSYYEGLEYVLSLIDYSKENSKKKMSDLIYRVLFDESSMKEEAEKLRIDTSKHSKILKFI